MTRPALLSRAALRPPTLRRGEVLLVGASVAVLVYLTIDLLAGGLVTEADQWIYDEWSHHHSRDLTFVNKVGSTDIAIPILVIAVLVTVHALWRIWPLLLALGNSAVTAVVVIGLKYAVGRPGPGKYALRQGYPGYFPSGHAATAAVCLGTAAYLLWTLTGRARLRVSPSTAGIVVGLVGGAVVGGTIVASGHHWASDVLGSLAVCAIILTFGFATARERVPPEKTFRR